MVAEQNMAQAKPKRPSPSARRAQAKLKSMLGPTTFRESKRRPNARKKHEQQAVLLKDLATSSHLQPQRGDSPKRSETIEEISEPMRVSPELPSDNSNGAENRPAKAVKYLTRSANRSLGIIHCSKDRKGTCDQSTPSPSPSQHAQGSIHDSSIIDVNPTPKVSGKAAEDGRDLTPSRNDGREALNDQQNVAESNCVKENPKSRMHGRKRGRDHSDGETIAEDNESMAEDDKLEAITNENGHREDDSDEFENDEMLVQLLQSWDANSEDRSQGGAETARPAVSFLGTVGDGGEASQKCNICGELENSNSTLLCDLCDCAVHMGCLTPKLNSPPRVDEWLCPDCEIQREEEGTAFVVPTDGNRTDSGTENIETQRLQDECRERMKWRNRPIVSAQGGKEQWLFQGNCSFQGRVRVGPNFQADVPEWRGEPYDDEPDKERPHFGSEEELSEEVKEQMRQQAEARIANNESPVGWLPATSLPEGTPEKWLQCTRALYEAGDMLPSGKVARKTTECGKWRRAPLTERGGPDWECSCAVAWDPHHADCNVPQELPRKEIERRLKAVSAIVAKRQALAEEEQWEKRFAELANWKKEHGHCHVALREALGQWLQLQRMDLYKSRLPPIRKSRLLEMGVVLDMQEARWEESFHALAAFQKEHGHCDVGRHCGAAKLAQWAKAQRVMARQPTRGNNQQFQRICRLLELGFPFDEEWKS